MWFFFFFFLILKTVQEPVASIGSSVRTGVWSRRVNASPPGFFDDGEWRENLGLQGTYEHRMMLIGGTCHVPIPMQQSFGWFSSSSANAPRDESNKLFLNSTRRESPHGSDDARSWVSIGRSAAGDACRLFKSQKMIVDRSRHGKTSAVSFGPMDAAGGASLDHVVIQGMKFLQRCLAMAHG
jgi:hypothetical protein